MTVQIHFYSHFPTPLDRRKHVLSLTVQIFFFISGYYSVRGTETWSFQCVCVNRYQNGVVVSNKFDVCNHILHTDRFVIVLSGSVPNLWFYFTTLFLTPSISSQTVDL